MLDCQIPLLHVTGSQATVDREDPLPQASVRSNRNRRYCRAAAEYKGWMHIIQGLLGYGLQERELRGGERRGNSSLLNPDQTISSSHDCILLEQVGQSHSRSKIQPMQLTGGFRETILPEEVQLLSLQIEHSAL